MRFGNAGLLFVCAALAQAGVYFEPLANGGFGGRLPAGVASLMPDQVRLWNRHSSLAVRFEGAARGVSGIGEQQAGGVSHYIRGNDPGQWRMNVPRYQRVRFADVYPGVALVYRAGQDGIEFDFEVGPRARASEIQLAFEERIRVDASGALVAGQHRLSKPRAWQQRGGVQQDIDVAFRLLGPKRAGFRLGRYDRSLPLTIDPLVEFAAYLGGSDAESNTRMQMSEDGAIYLAGTTRSLDFPAALPDANLLNRPVVMYTDDAYVTRLKPDASGQDWALFIGGTARESVAALGQDGLGNLYLLGATASANFPVTPGAWRGTIGGGLMDSYLVKIDARTGQIKAGTFLGLSNPRLVLGVDAAGGAYVGTWFADPKQFSATPGAFQTTGGPAGLIRLNPGLTARVYGTYLPELGVLTVDAAGNAIIAGGSRQNGGYVMKIDAAGAKQVFRYEIPNAVSVSDVKLDGSGAIYTLGLATGETFPEVNPIRLSQPQWTSPADASQASPFLLKLPPDGSAPLQATYFRGAEYTDRSGSGGQSNMRLALQPGGAPCLLNLGGTGFVPAPGALIVPAGTYYGNPGTVICVAQSGTSLTMKSPLPVLGGAYTQAAFSPDGALVVAGTSYGGLKTTPGVLQPDYGGVIQRSLWPPPDSWADELSGDAAIVRLSLNNPAPRIAYTAPESLVATTEVGGTTSIVVYGSGFSHGMEILLDGRKVNAAAGSQGSITISDIDYAALRPGRHRIDLSTPAPGGGADSKELNVVNAAPLALSVSPASVTAGAGETKVVIRGSNLSPDSVLRWNGQPRPATVVAQAGPFPTYRFELILPPGELAQPASAEITVTNPPPGGGTSPPVRFMVLPGAGTGVPYLGAPSSVDPGVTVILRDSLVTPAKITISGAVFPADVRAFWDGVEVPAESLAPKNGITITPPADAMKHVAAHKVSVLAGGVRSNTLQVIVARELPNLTRAFTADPQSRRLYVLADQPEDKTELRIFDLRTGDPIVSSAGPLEYISSMAVSVDGNYVYLAVRSRVLRRYNVQADAFDAEWNLTTVGDISSMLCLPGGEDILALAVSTPYERDIVIFDHGRIRPGTVRSAKVAITDNLYFATGSRVFFAPDLRAGSPGCWNWADYDETGFTRGPAAECATDPAEVVHDRGFAYLTDDSRKLLVSMPLGPAMSSARAMPAMVADEGGAKAYLAAISDWLRVIEYDIETGEQKLVTAVGLPFYGYSGSLKLIRNPDNKLVVFSGSMFAIVP